MKEMMVSKERSETDQIFCEIIMNIITIIKIKST